jgi:hypothetical protein
MGLNLTLSFERNKTGPPVLCSERHRLDLQDYDLFDRIKEDAVPLVGGVLWYDDDGIEETKEDCYGDSLTFILAHTLVRRIGDIKLGIWDSAVLAFLKSIPAETRVILWWS